MEKFNQPADKNGHVLLPGPPIPHRAPRVPHCRFILKIGKKSEKNQISNADP